MKSDLFNLSKVLGLGYSGYWMDRDFNAYSTKRGAPYKLARTGTGSCRGMYYSFYTGRYSVTHRVSELKTTLMNDPTFKQWLNSTSSTTAVSASSVTSRGFIVGSTRGSYMSFSSYPKIHSTEASAKAECERLAKTSPGTAYTYFEIKGTAIAGGVNWS